MAAEMLLKRRRPGDERKPEAVVDHGEATGGQCEALAVGAGDMIAAGSRFVGPPRLARQFGSGSIEFTAAQRVEEIALQDDALTLAAGEPFRHMMLGARRHCVAGLLARTR